MQSYFLASYLRHHLSQPVDRDHFLGSDVDRTRKVRFHQSPDTLKALVDVKERPGLFAIAPNLNLTAIGSRGNLPADSGRSLFASAVPRALGPKNVVKS